MNRSLSDLLQTAQKEQRHIIGLMSGTSLDGLDIALCQVSGSGQETAVQCREFVTIPYSDSEKNLLKRISSVEQASLSDLCYIHTWLGRLHAKFILNALNSWGVQADTIDCIASHGQTIYHLPARDLKEDLEPISSTLQIGDADQISMLTGIPTLSDFRQKHTAAGGEGAPMAGFVDELLFTSADESRILLNIGGIGNFTWLPASGRKSVARFTTDTGPGNTLIDKLTHQFFNLPFDRDAGIASAGTVDESLLGQLLSDPWFDEKEEKTTGPEYFSLEWLRDLVTRAGFAPGSLKPETLIRTVTELSARTIARRIEEFLPEGEKPVIYVSGGGARNPLLIQRISELLPGISVQNSASLGIDPDAKEAIIFAVLANEMLAGEGFRIRTDDQKVQFGKISLPH
ncbi:MAG: anhydro-N-acetylmuramic acid kinase [Balneolaceae bacterium]|nr:MAG: anhydro-N-acetylmuramic acid kinase [Balneolaceae bacterium]